jgi:putative membrane protein
VSSFSQDKKGAVKFFAPIAIGVCAGILASTKAVLWICETYPLQSYLFFTGLVLGSAPLIIGKAKKIPFKIQYLGISVLSFLSIMAVTGLGSSNSGSYVAIESLATVNDGLMMAFAGVFSVSLMAVPGISGSVMLMVINQYGTVYNAVGKAVDMLAFIAQGDYAQAGAAFRTVALIIPFLLGALVGLVVVAKIMAFLLKRFEALVYYAVGGVVVAAMVTLVTEGVMTGLTGNVTAFDMIIALVCLVAGVLGTMFLDVPKKTNA